MNLEQIKNQAKIAAEEIISVAGLKAGDLLVVGCSSSEIVGSKIGTDSDLPVAETVFSAIYEQTKKNGIFLATQCCEHLNRAIIVEREYAEKKNLETVNVIPQKKGGGSFSTAAYSAFEDAVAVESIKANAGLDIGQTLIGMHLKAVAVPVRLSVKTIGEAILTAARTRDKFIGGERAIYDQSKM